MRVEQRQIWEVVKDGFKARRFALGGEEDGKDFAIPVGEKIEIRFPYAWHFRTTKGEYCQASEEDIVKYCEYLGKVFQDVAWLNQTTLEEILTHGLYD